MTRYALFLRGINVGGIKVAMAQLREVLAGIGGTTVKTWLASGNVAMDWDGDARSLWVAAQRAVGERFGYEAHLVVVNFDSLAGIVSSCPFDADPGHHRYAIICDDQTAAASLASAAPDLDNSVEQIAQKGAVVYWRCPKGSTLTTAFARHQAGFAGRSAFTSRNLNTLEKMVGRTTGLS
ncbi:DUF1697 domain-containing protein [Propionibacterium sp.]|uniref:DUF1697 domain-containing protein n=1 Tax=Propionibacterium sp. TaxID=1977903 RepID=UPI0039E98AEB